MGQSTSCRAVPVRMGHTSLRSSHSRRSDSPRRVKDVIEDGSHNGKGTKHRAASDRHIRKKKGKTSSLGFTRHNIGMTAQAAAHKKQAAGFHNRLRAFLLHRRPIRELKTPPHSKLRSTVEVHGWMWRLRRLRQKKECVVCTESRPLTVSPSDRRLHIVPTTLTHVRNVFADGSAFLLHPGSGTIFSAPLAPIT